MKLRSIIPILAAGIMALSAVVIGAHPAAAASPSILCIGLTNQEWTCAQPNGSSPVAMPTETQPFEPEFDWDWWLYNGLNHTGQIQESDTSLCMQLDHNAGNTVIEATCNGASYQKWTAFLAPNGYSWMFYSMWDMNQCLTYNASHHYLDTVACNGAWYQSFAAGPAPPGWNPD
jgi:hypothetical protein